MCIEKIPEGGYLVWKKCPQWRNGNLVKTSAWLTDLWPAENCHYIFAWYLCNLCCSQSRQNALRGLDLQVTNAWIYLEIISWNRKTILHNTAMKYTFPQPYSSVGHACRTTCNCLTPRMSMTWTAVIHSHLSLLKLNILFQESAIRYSFRCPSKHLLRF